jgi:assimilatory nitrate reductase catalytic subunit
MQQAVSRHDAGMYHGIHMESTGTHCPYCALQCGMNLVPADDRLTVVARDFPTNNGGLCRKGWTAAELLYAPDRLTTPLVRARKDEPLRPVSWSEALDRAVEGIRRIQAAHGRDAFGVFGGGGLTNEKSYMLGKFARVALRTGNIDYNGRFCMASPRRQTCAPLASTAACRFRWTISAEPRRS